MDKQLYEGTDVFEYYFIPNEGFHKSRPLFRILEDADAGKPGIKYPFSKLGPLKCHATPHFVLTNAAIKLATLQFKEDFVVKMLPK